MVPYLNLKAQYLSIKDEIDSAIAGVVDRQEFILGSEVTAFEAEFGAVCHANFAIATNSGTSALHLALLAAGVGPGDEVITVSFSFVATVAAIRYTGATPVLVDIEPGSFNMDVGAAARAITSRTRVILPVHLFGQPADMDPLMELARAHGLLVIEDAAQAHLAEYKGRRVGSIGDFAAFSFYPTKNLGAFGEGGLLTVRGEEHARKARLLRDWGAPARYLHELRGYNYRMEGMQGAVLRAKLRHLPAWTERRRYLAARYRELLRGSAVVAPADGPHVYHVFGVRVADRDSVQQRLAARGIATSINYPLGIHQQVAHRDLGYATGSLPVTEQAAREQLSLPMYPELTDAQVEEVAAALREESFRR